MNHRLLILSATLCSVLTGQQAALPRLNFTFVENRGQTDVHVRYLGSGPDMRAWFKSDSVIFKSGEAVVTMKFAGALAATQPVIKPGFDTGERTNYILGFDTQQWKVNLPVFSAIRYAGIWPGVELRYEAHEARLKSEYVVAPGASLDSILLRFDSMATIAADGSLHLTAGSGEFVEAAPTLYQMDNGRRRVVSGGFRRASSESIGFYASGYDPTKPLVIDPFIVFSGYFGGSSQDNITAVKIDNSGNIVVAGWTTSSDLPSSNGARKIRGGGVDAFIASFRPNGGGLNYCTYLGGSGDDRAFGLAIDTNGNPFLTGWTSSVNFPLVVPLQAKLGGTRDAFVAKLNAAGNTLLFSTYLGGSSVDAGYGIAINSANEVVIGGDTSSTDLATTAGVVQRTFGGGQDVFVAKLTASNSLLFLTYLGGSGMDHCNSIATISAGGIVIGGYTRSSNFPTSGRFKPIFQTKLLGSQDAFVTKLNVSGTNYIFSTYLGGTVGLMNGSEQVNGVAMDSQTIVVAGVTGSPDFPVTVGAFQSQFAGETDGFVTRFGPFGDVMQSSYLGGVLNDTVSAVALDFHGNPYVTGSTASQDFPVAGSIQNANAGGLDGFAVKMNWTLSTVVWGTYLGGSGSDGANAIAVDTQTSVVIAGQTNSGNFPASGNLQRSSSETLSSFITKIAPSFSLGVAYPYQGQQNFTVDPWRLSSYLSSTQYGNATDIPVAGDWTGSGVKRIGVFRSGVWYLDSNGNGVLDAGDKTVAFGQIGDIPIVGDWRGTGKPALGLFRQGTFILDFSGHLSGVPTGLSDATFPFGQAGDVPVVADWNGSGSAKVGVFRNGLWLVDYNGDRVFNGSDRSYIYGQAGDIPVVGDWDSSGTPNKIGVYRGGLWILDYDGDNTWTTPYVNEMVIALGFAGYAPLVF